MGLQYAVNFKIMKACNHAFIVSTSVHSGMVLPAKQRVSGGKRRNGVRKAECIP